MPLSVGALNALCSFNYCLVRLSFCEGKSRKKFVCFGKKWEQIQYKNPKSQKEMFNIQNTFNQNLFSVLNI